jgi:hypothetical protein
VDLSDLPSSSPLTSVQRRSTTETESDTIWIESVAGRMFELDQNASIRDCYPGSFPEIDSYDEKLFHEKGA